MPIGFGFAVGDFIAGINFLIDGIKSFSKTHGAKAHHQELGRDLSSLKNALDGIRTLSLNQAQVAQITAVNTAVDGCRLSIDVFVQRNSRFDSLDSTPSSKWSLGAFKKGVLGIRWAILKKTEVASFRTTIQQHCSHILMLLATLEIKQRQEAEQRDVDHKNLTGSIGVKQASLAQSIEAQYVQTKAQIQGIGQLQNDALTAQSMANTQFKANFQSLVTQLGALSLQESDGAALQNRMLQILLQGLTQNENMIRNQQQAFREIQELKTMFRVSQEIPPQVLLSTPVILLDACGRIAPFHLEFIDSAEAFVAVLKIRFKDLGLRKVEKGQFSLEDTRRKKFIELTEPWAKTVRPGQHIGMSMIFRLQESPTTNCPSCGQENQGSNTEDIHCGNIRCRLTYRRIEEASFPSNENLASVRDKESGEQFQSDIPRRDANRPNDMTDDEIRNYTRVHILSRNPALSPPAPPAPPTPPFPPYEVGTKPCPKCGTENEAFSGEEIECGNISCRIKYHELTSSSRDLSLSALEDDSGQDSSSVIRPRSTNKRKHSAHHAPVDRAHRVRIGDTKIPHSPAPFPAHPPQLSARWTCGHCGDGLHSIRFDAYCTGCRCRRDSSAIFY